MSCFLAPVVEAIITTTTSKIISKKEKKAGVEAKYSTDLTPFSKKLNVLSYSLWGGSALLALEHIWHGEIVAQFPFFTAAKNPASMLQEITHVGGTMCLVVTAVWAISMGFVYFYKNNVENKKTKEKE